MRGKDQSKYSGFERRKHPRLRKEFEVQIKGEKLGEASGKTLTISLEGASIQLGQSLGDTKEFEIAIKIPGWQGTLLGKEDEVKVLHAKAKIAWAQENATNNFFQYGLQLSDIPEIDQEGYKRYLQSQLKKEEGSDSYFM